MREMFFDESLNKLTFGELGAIITRYDEKREIQSRNQRTLHINSVPTAQRRKRPINGTRNKQYTKFIQEKRVSKKR